MVCTRNEEQWVEEVTANEYERIFRHIHRVLSGETPTMSLTHPTTLASFNAALDRILDLETSSVNIGKCIGFDAKTYVLQFGNNTVSIPIQQHPAAHSNSDSALGADATIGAGDEVESADATAPPTLSPTLPSAPYRASKATLPTVSSPIWSNDTPTRRRRTASSVPLRSPVCLSAPTMLNLSMASPKTPTFMKRYHNDTLGDRLVKFTFTDDASNGTSSSSRAVNDSSISAGCDSSDDSSSFNNSLNDSGGTNFARVTTATARHRRSDSISGSRNNAASSTIDLRRLDRPHCRLRSEICSNTSMHSARTHTGPRDRHRHAHISSSSELRCSSLSPSIACHLATFGEFIPKSSTLHPRIRIAAAPKYQLHVGSNRGCSGARLHYPSHSL